MFKKIKLRSLLGNSWVLLIAAVLVAAGLTFLLYTYLTDREAKLKAELANQRKRAGIEVVVPNRDVPIGTPLASGDFVAREIAPDLVYDDMIRASDFESYKPSRLVRPVRRGLPLRAGDIDALRGRDFSDVLPAGQRAVTLEIDMINSTAAMVRPGNRVDLYWVGRVVTKQPGTAAVTSDNKSIQLLLPNVMILATGQDVRPRDAGEAMENANRQQLNQQLGQPTGTMTFDTVTVQVPAEQSARIALAQKLGSLRLILRNSDDPGSKIPRTLNETNLFSNTNAKDGPAVEIIAGGGGNTTTSTLPGAASTDTRDMFYEPPPQTAPGASAVAPASGANDAANALNTLARQLQKLDTRAASSRN